MHHYTRNIFIVMLTPHILVRFRVVSVVVRVVGVVVRVSIQVMIRLCSSVDPFLN